MDRWGLADDDGDNIGFALEGNPPELPRVSDAKTIVVVSRPFLAEVRRTIGTRSSSNLAASHFPSLLNLTAPSLIDNDEQRHDRSVSTPPWKVSR